MVNFDGLFNGDFATLYVIVIPLYFRGDFRTGKRLNMRRIIPYIASNFQNDRIWLRRSQPSKREYQIVLAVDDSSSMRENNCNQMAYESLAVITTALQKLECGQIGICRYSKYNRVIDYVHVYCMCVSMLGLARVWSCCIL